MRSKVEMMVENININQNVLACAHEVGADRVVSMTSTCVFPDKARAPPVLAAPRRTAPTRAAPPPPPLQRAEATCLPHPGADRIPHHRRHAARRPAAPLERGLRVCQAHGGGAPPPPSHPSY
jgi:hypothetical protein